MNIQLAEIYLLQQEIKKILTKIIPSGCELVLLDFPNHSNVGDSAIWLGEIAYFTTVVSGKILWVSDCSFADRGSLPAFSSGALIVIHGGGNFGDLWPRHQYHRERIIRHYRNHRIVQLPQSIHFTEPVNATRCSEVLNDHPDFHLCVRDYSSLKLATSLHRGSSYLCPDMALFLDPPVPPPDIDPLSDIIALLRTDKEMVSEFRDRAEFDNINIHLTDWLSEPVTLARCLNQISRHFPMPLQSLQQFVLNLMATERVRRGCTLLTSGKVVITDRLHGHILCTLLNIPHVILDNSYQKISAFRDTWKTGLELCQQASSLSEAVNKASAMQNF